VEPRKVTINGGFDGSPRSPIAGWFDGKNLSKWMITGGSLFLDPHPMIYQVGESFSPGQLHPVDETIFKPNFLNMVGQQFGFLG
jgi:hypothetical protein